MQRNTKEECWGVRAVASNLAKSYGLPKIHKERIPLGPTVTLPGTATYGLGEERWRCLKPLMSESSRCVLEKSKRSLVLTMPIPLMKGLQSKRQVPLTESQENQRNFSNLLKFTSQQTNGRIAKPKLQSITLSTQIVSASSKR